MENADGKRFSAGYFVNEILIDDPQTPDDPNPKVPEMATIWYMLLGVAAIAFKKGWGGIPFVLGRDSHD